MKIHPSSFIVPIVFTALLIYFFKQRAYVAMPDTHDLKKQIDQTGTSYLADHSNGALVIAFYQHGNQSFQGFGKISNSNANPPNAYTIFEIGSVTKIFTATLLEEMADNGL
jgi:CubicO group peptidase (beta-lactamase class C family)